MERPQLCDCAHQLKLTLLGRQVVLATNSPRIHQILTDTYSSRNFIPQAASERIPFLCQLRPGGSVAAAFWTPRAGFLAMPSPDRPGEFSLTRLERGEGVPAGNFGPEGSSETLSEDSVLELFAIHFQRRVLFDLLLAQPDLRMVHAGALTCGDAGLLILAPTRGGKTTLSVAGALAGMSFMSDDLSVVNLARGTLLPFARATRMRRGTLAAEPEFAALETTTIVDLRGETRYYVHPEDLRSDALGAETRLTHVVRLVDFGEAASLVHRGAGTMAGHLVEADCFATGREALELMWRWGAVLDGVECADLVAGPPMVTARFLREYIG